MKKVFLALTAVFAALAINAQGTVTKQEGKPAAVKSETKAPAKSVAVLPAGPVLEAKPVAATEVKHVTSKTAAKPMATPAKTEAKPAAKETPNK